MSITLTKTKLIMFCLILSAVTLYIMPTRSTECINCKTQMASDTASETYQDFAKNTTLPTPAWLDFTKEHRSNTKVGQFTLVIQPDQTIEQRWEIDTMNLIDILEYEEGYRSKPYLCSEGYVTVGYGTKLHNQKGLDPREFSIEVTRDIAKLLLLEKVAKLEAKLSASKYGKTFDKLNADRRAIILSMAYQMGVSGVLKFPSMWRHAGNENWEGMRDEALDSLWARQTPSRAHRHAAILSGYDTIQSIYGK